MKHLFTMIAAGCMLAAIPASAQLQMPTQAKNVSGIKEKAVQMRERCVKKTPATRAEFPDPIYEADGNVKNYVKTYNGCYVYMEMEYVNGQEVEAQIVWGDDNTVYFPNIISMMPTDTYTKGTLNGDKITVSLPQTAYYEEYEYDGELVQSYVLLSLLLPLEFDNGVTIYEPVEDEYEITFTVADDGTVTLDPIDNTYVLGLVGYEEGDGLYWMGFAEFAMSFAPDNGTSVVDPTTLDNTPYSYFASGYDTPTPAEPEFGYKVNVAFNGDDVYFTGFCLDETSWWFKGHKDGDKVIVENNQKMGVLAGIYNVSLMFGQRDEDAYGGFSLLPADSQFVFSYDEDAKTFTSATPEVVMFVNALPDQIYYLTMIENPTLLYQPTAAGNPRDPWNLTFNAATYDKYGYGIFDYYLPIVSTDGVLLERKNMYYQLFIDGELLELDAAEYGLPEDTENVPYNFNANAIVCSRLSTYHEMIFHIEGFDKIGVKLFNVCDGVTYESNLVELDVVAGDITSAVNEISDNDIVVSETYYDLSGRKVSNPQSGVFVKRTLLDNGTVKVSKSIK